MRRFDLVVDDCRQLGKNFENDELLARFMNGLDTESKIYESRIEAIRSEKNMAEKNPTLEPVTLQSVQSQLLSLDEEKGLTSPNSNTKRYNTGTPYAMPATKDRYRKQAKPPASKPQRNIVCSYKPCGKKGHTYAECRKRKRDEEYKAKGTKRQGTSQKRTKPFSKADITCHKCKKKGHYANECPEKTTTPQQAHRASVDTKITRTSSSNESDVREMVMMAIGDAPTKWNTRPRRPTCIPISGFRDFLPDSGATSHFVNALSDLMEPAPCNLEVTIADGSKVRATHVGETKINFISDSGTPSTLVLASVYYIPGLSRHLFSLQAFTRETPFSVEINHHYTRLNFGDGETYTWPIIRDSDTNDRYAFPITEDTIPAPGTSGRQAANLPTRPIPLETGMQRLGFRATKGLLTGTLHRIWEDCHIQAGPDTYCWSSKLAISRTAPRNLHRPVYYPTKPFEMIFVDVIKNPHQETLTLSTTYDGHLLIVCPFSHYTDWRGLENFESKTIIKAIEAFRTSTTSKGATVKLQYLRADAGSYFTSNEFIDWGNTNNIKISIAAPHHQEMNSVVERQWQTMSQIMRAILVHARLSNHFYHFAAKYAKDILNVLPSKNLLDHNGNPTTPYFNAFRTKPKIGNFRVFGCPASFKRHGALTRRTQTQQAT
jgi:hypothetical protein